MTSVGNISRFTVNQDWEISSLQEEIPDLILSVTKKALQGNGFSNFQLLSFETSRYASYIHIATKKPTLAFAESLPVISNTLLKGMDKFGLSSELKEKLVKPIYALAEIGKEIIAKKEAGELCQTLKHVKELLVIVKENGPPNDDKIKINELSAIYNEIVDVLSQFDECKSYQNYDSEQILKSFLRPLQEQYKRIDEKAAKELSDLIETSGEKFWVLTPEFLLNHSRALFDQIQKIDPKLIARGESDSEGEESEKLSSVMDYVNDLYEHYKKQPQQETKSVLNEALKRVLGFCNKDDEGTGLTEKIRQLIKAEGQDFLKICEGHMSAINKAAVEAKDSLQIEQGSRTIQADLFGLNDFLNFVNFLENASKDEQRKELALEQMNSLLLSLCSSSGVNIKEFYRQIPQSNDPNFWKLSRELVVKLVEMSESDFKSMSMFLDEGLFLTLVSKDEFKLLNLVNAPFKTRFIGDKDKSHPEGEPSSKKKKESL